MFLLEGEEVGKEICDLKEGNKDFPGGPLVKNLPANAGDTDSPCSRKIPHAADQ